MNLATVADLSWCLRRCIRTGCAGQPRWLRSQQNSIARWTTRWRPLGWIGRYDGKSFTAFREDYSLRIYGYPAHAIVLDMLEDKDGILWFGCTDGVWRLDGESFINVTRNGPWPVPDVD